MTRPDAYDQSWGRADPVQAYADGVRLIYGYLSWDPSKNITPEYIRACHSAGIAVWPGWESQTGRPLGGAYNGGADGAEAARQFDALIAAVGYGPRSRINIPFSCDEDVTPNATIGGYYDAAQAAMNGRYDAGVYGEADVVDYLAARGMKTGRFQTYAWSSGRLSPNCDLYQYSNNMSAHGASVDYDTIIHAELIGAWWPPGHALDAPTQGGLGDGMYELIRAADGGVYAWAPNFWYHVPDQEHWSALQNSPLCVGNKTRVVSNRERDVLLQILVYTRDTTSLVLQGVTANKATLADVAAKVTAIANKPDAQGGTVDPQAVADATVVKLAQKLGAQ